MSGESIPIAAYRFMADGAQAEATNATIKRGIEDINNTKLTKIDQQFVDLKKAALDLLPALSVATIAGFATSAIRAADAMGDAADRAELSVSTFSRLNYIAQETDVEFSELTGGLKAYRVALDSARDGEGAAADALARLNLTASELINLPIEDQLGMIADAFASVTNTAERTKIAQDLFKAGGQAMLPLLSQGSAGLREMAREADLFSQVLDDKAVASIDRFTKALGRMASGSQTAIANEFGNIIFRLFGTGDELKDTQYRLDELIARREILQKNPTIWGEAGLSELVSINDQIEKLQRKLFELQAGTLQSGALGPDLPFKKWLDELQFDSIQPFKPTVSKIPEEDSMLREIRERRRKQEAEANERRLNDLADINERTRRAMEENGREITDDLIGELDRRHALEEWDRERRRSREKDLQDTLTDFRRQGTLAAQTLLTAYGGKYASVAKAILAVEKAHAIAKTIIATKAAAVAALQYYGPTPWGYAAAAGAIAYGVAQVAAIASTVIGGASSAAGSPHNPITVEPSADTSGDLSTPAPAEQRSVQIIVQGNIYSGRETADFFIEQLRQRINEYDTVVINPTSRQARELVPERTT